MSKVDNFRANLAKLVAKPHGRKKEVAVAAGITPQYFSSILTGVSDPGLDIAVRIADALGQSLDEMLLLPSDFARRLDSTSRETSPVRKTRERSAVSPR